MAAVVEAVTSVFTAVGNAVGAVVDGVGKIIETVVTEVVEPIVKTVGNTIQAALDDPLGTIAKIGIAIVAPELLPAFNFGYSVATGMPLDKAILNTGLSMIGAEVGGQIGTELTKTFDLGSTASDLLATGAKGAVTSTLKGQDALSGAVGSITSNLINQGANSAYKGLTNTGGDDGKDTTSANTGLPVTGGAQGCASTTSLGALPSTNVDDSSFVGSQPSSGTATTQVGQNLDIDTGSCDDSSNSNVPTTKSLDTSGGLSTLTCGSGATTDLVATTGPLTTATLATNSGHCKCCVYNCWF